MIMEKIIISSEDIIGGSPRIKGRRLDVNHVITGIINYKSVSLYQSDFEVSNTDVRHAIMYCKDEVCVSENVPQSCNGCSKKFSKDIKKWNKLDFKETKDWVINKVGNKSIYLGNLKELKEQFDGTDVWKNAKELYNKLKIELDLPCSYKQLTQHPHE